MRYAYVCACAYVCVGNAKPNFNKNNANKKFRAKEALFDLSLK